VVTGIKGYLKISPNPFSTSTTISFTRIGQSAEGIELRICDLSGRVVRTFPSSLLSLRSSVTWDGRDDNGEAVSAGVYLIKGEIGSKEVSEKVMYVR
ncbi:T9SS type A sorting domain-containing protein, partial [candidate division WOR-3 bacterium]|nr:T9SS type A sorting domain-containing protein [candidate division WOR-3 bacterium]